MSPLCFSLVTQNALWPSLGCKITFQQARHTGRKPGRRMGSVGRLPAGTCEEGQGCPPAPLLPGGFHRTSPSTYRSALLKAKSQNGSWNKIHIITEKLPEYVSVSIFGEVILFQKIILKNISMDCTLIMLQALY